VEGDRRKSWQASKGPLTLRPAHKEQRWADVHIGMRTVRQRAFCRSHIAPEALAIRASLLFLRHICALPYFTYIYKKPRRKILPNRTRTLPPFHFLLLETTLLLLPILDLMSITVRPHGAGGKFFIHLRFIQHARRSNIPQKSRIRFCSAFLPKGGLLIVWVFGRMG
jgi:hypothetical protein